MAVSCSFSLLVGLFVVWWCCFHVLFCLVVETRGVFFVLVMFLGFCGHIDYKFMEYIHMHNIY